MDGKGTRAINRFLSTALMMRLVVGEGRSRYYWADAICRWIRSVRRTPTDESSRPSTSREHSSSARDRPSVSTLPYTPNGCRRIRRRTKCRLRRIPPTTRRFIRCRSAAGDVAARLRTGGVEIPSHGNTGSRSGVHQKAARRIIKWFNSAAEPQRLDHTLFYAEYRGHIIEGVTLESKA